MNQEFDISVIDLVKLKRFYPYKYMSDFERFKEKLRSKEKFYSSLTSRNITDKKYELVLNIWNKCEMKSMIITTCI